MKHILVTTDYSKSAESAYPFVREYLEKYKDDGIKCSLLSVLEDLSEGGVQFQFALAMLDSHGVREEMKKKAIEDMERIREVHFKGHSVETAVISADKPVHEEILNYSKEHGVDLIVIATHGRSGVAHVFLGSVTEKLIRKSDIPVLVVPVDKAPENATTP